MKVGTVSVIIPVYNSVEYLDETLRSVVAQAYSDWECICVDDGSTDGSDEVIKKWSAKNPKIKYFERPEHLPAGGNAARNFGFEVSEGEFIQWFDSDDIMHVDMLYYKVEALNNSPSYNYVVCHTGSFVDDNLNTLTPYEQNLDSTNLIMDHLTYKTKFFTPGPMFRRSFLATMDLFNIKLKRHQEREIFFRVVLKDAKYLIIEDVLIFRRMHNSQLSLKANRSSEKNVLKYEVNRLKYRHYVDSGNQQQAVFNYFRDFFFRSIYRFFRERKYLYSLRSTILLFKSLLKLR